MRKSVMAALALALALLPCGASAAQPDEAKGQQVIRAFSAPSQQGSADYFTGRVRVDPVTGPNADAPYSLAYVTFEPGARTFWHTHPAGQRLLVVSGHGRTGTEDGTILEIGPGDFVWCPPNIRHWHGAAPDRGMTHIALTGTKDGKNVTWMEAVSDAQYNGKAGGK